MALIPPGPELIICQFSQGHSGCPRAHTPHRPRLRAPPGEMGENPGDPSAASAFQTGGGFGPVGVHRPSKTEV